MVAKIEYFHPMTVLHLESDQGYEQKYTNNRF